MADRAFNIHIGTAADLAALQATTREINATSAATRAAERDQRVAASLRQEIGRLERQQRAEAFARLPAEEQLNQLLQRRAELQRRMDQPGVARSEKVQLAYQLAGKGLDAQIAEAQSRAGVIRDQALVSRQRELFQLARQQREQAFAQLSPKQQLVALEEKRERLAQMLARVGDNELRRSSLLVAQRQTEARIGALQMGRQTLGGRIMGGLANAAINFGIPLSAGAAATAALYKAREMARQITAEAEATIDRASRLGVSTGRAQEFQFAGGKTNLSEGDIATNLRQISLAQDRALAGNKDLLASFQRFGVSVADLRSQRPDELFLQMARNAAEGGKATANMTDAVRLLGRSADKTLGAFRQGFADAARELDKLGGVIDADVLQRLDESAKNMRTIGAIGRAALAPFVADASNVAETAAFLALRFKEVTGALVSGVPLLREFRSARAFGEIAFWMKDGVAWLIDGLPYVDKYADKLREIKAVSDLAPGGRRRRLERESRAGGIEAENRNIDRIKAAMDSTTDPARLAALTKLLAERQARLSELETGKSQKTEIAGRIEDMRAELELLEKQNRLAGLSPQQQITELTRQRATLEAKIADATTRAARERENGLDLAALKSEEEALVSRLARARLDEQILGLREKMKPEEALARPQVTSDSLRRIGLFRGGADRDLAQQLNEARAANRYLAAILRNQDRTQQVRIVR